MRYFDAFAGIGGFSLGIQQAYSNWEIRHREQQPKTSDIRSSSDSTGSPSELGYDVQWQVLNSKNHGVPQNRERVIIVGHLRGTSRPKVFPIAGSNEENFGKDRPIESIDYSYPSSQTRRGRIKKDYIGALDRKTQIGILTPNDVGKTVRSGGRGSLTKKHNWDALYDGCKIRRLTPLECERLQAFPDDWTKYGVKAQMEVGRELIEISDTQRYKMCGNAVTVNVIKAVFERIFDHETR